MLATYVDDFLSSTAQILANERVAGDHGRGRAYYEACDAFVGSLSNVMDAMAARIAKIGADDVDDAETALLWGIVVFALMLVISPVLLAMSRNTISSMQVSLNAITLLYNIPMQTQVYAKNVEQTTSEMRREQRKRNQLLYRILPKEVVGRMMAGVSVVDHYQSATLFFSTVVGFSQIVRACTALEVVRFLNTLYSVMDGRMDGLDVHKVETIQDSYLVASGLPKPNGERHAVEICRMALDLVAACGRISRPDDRDTKVQIRVGIHTGT